MSQDQAPPLRIRESDGSPNLIPVFEIVVSNGTLTDLGGGKVGIATGAGGGSGNINPGSANYLAFYPSAGTTLDDTLMSVTTGSGIAPLNMVILTSNAASPTSGDMYFIASNGGIYLRFNSSGTIYSVQLGSIS